MRRVSPLGIMLGVLTTQVVSYVFGFAFALVCLFIYGNKSLVALFEYPSLIAISLSIGLVSTAVSGFVAVEVARNSIINAIICGVFTLAISLSFLYLLEFKYLGEYRWMLLMSLFLTIPFAALGGHISLRLHNNTILPAKTGLG